MNEIPKLTTLQRAQRAADFVRTIPMKWVDSNRFEEAELSCVRGCVQARYRVNTPECVYIVRTEALLITPTMLEQIGIRNARCFLMAVRSLLGDAFPRVITDEGAAEKLRLNNEFTAASEQLGLEVEAVYTNGKCERTGRDFRFEDWIEEPAANNPPKTDSHPLSPPKEKWPGEEYARNAIIRLREQPELQRNVSEFCRTIAEEQGVPEIAGSLKKLLYEKEYKPLWKP